MKLSIIIPVFNSEKTIIRALNSIVDQKGHSFLVEIIIVDDASDDSSVAMVKSYIDKYGGRYIFRLLINASNQGVSKSRNRGLDSSTGDYVAFLDSDDVFNNGKLSIIEYVLLNNAVDFLFHSFSYDKLRFKIFTPRSLIKINRIFPFYNLVKNSIFTPCVIIKNKSFSGFNEKMTHMEDLELWTSILLQPNIRAYKLNMQLTMLGHVANEGNGLSSNRLSMRNMELIMYSSLASKFLSVKFLYPVYFVIHKLKVYLKD